MNAPDNQWEDMDPADAWERMIEQAEFEEEFKRDEEAIRQMEQGERK